MSTETKLADAVARRAAVGELSFVMTVLDRGVLILPGRMPDSIFAA